MANNTITVGLNRLEKPGQQTRDEILTELRAQGISATATAPVYDPLTGQLVQTTISFPDTANTQATEAVTANAGVATTTVPLPPAMLSLDCTAFSCSYVLDGKDPAQPTYFGASNFGLWATSVDGEKGYQLGSIEGNGVSNTFTDRDTNLSPAYFSVTTISLFNERTDADITIPSGGFTFTHDTVVTSVTLLNSIFIPRHTAPGANGMDIYLGNDGKAYLLGSFINGIFVGGGAGWNGNRTYAEAVAAGQM